MGLTWIRAACLALIAAGLAHAEAPIPARLDSLRGRLELRLNLPAGGNSKVTQAVMNAAINEALGEVCQDFNAYPKVDTLVARPDSEGVAWPGDFLRLRAVGRIIPRFGHHPAVYYPLQPVSDEDTLWRQVKDLSELELNPGDPIGPRRYVVGSRLFLYPKYDRRSSSDTALYLIDYYALAPQVAVDTDTVMVDPKYRAALLDKAAEMCATVRQDWDVAAKWLQAYELKVGRSGVREALPAGRKQ